MSRYIIPLVGYVGCAAGRAAEWIGRTVQGVAQDKGLAIFPADERDLAARLGCVGTQITAVVEDVRELAVTISPRRGANQHVEWAGRAVRARVDYQRFIRGDCRDGV